MQSHGAGSLFHVSQRGLGSHSVGRIDERRNTGGCRYQLTKQPQLFRRQLPIEKVDPCQVAARPSEADDKTQTNRVRGGEEDDRDRRGCSLGRNRHVGTSARDDHGSWPANQFVRQRRQPIELVLGPAVHSCD